MAFNDGEWLRIIFNLPIIGGISSSSSSSSVPLRADRPLNSSSFSFPKKLNFKRIKLVEFDFLKNACFVDMLRGDLGRRIWGQTDFKWSFKMLHSQHQYNNNEAMQSVFACLICVCTCVFVCLPKIEFILLFFKHVHFFQVGYLRWK